MRYFVLLLFTASLLGCSSVPNSYRSGVTIQQIVEIQSCEQISKGIDQMEEILASNTPSETEKLVKNTAISAAKTGVSMSGVLGSAGPFASLGVNLMQGLYSINATQRQNAIKQAAQEERDLLFDAYYYKECT